MMHRLLFHFNHAVKIIIYFSACIGYNKDI